MDLSERTPLADSVSKRLARAVKLGHLDGATPLTGMSLTLKPSAAQEAALTQLLKDQQDSTSPSFHKWLTPQQYGAQFGIADADLEVIENWLQSRGLQVQDVAPSRNRITFSGTAASVETAFGTSLQRLQADGQTFFENSEQLQLPTAFSGLVTAVSGLSSYRIAAPHAIRKPLPQNLATPDYTNTAGTNHYLVPWDVRQIYGSNTLVGSGFDGTGIKIGVLGQSAINTAQLTYFQQKTGQTTKLPTLVLVPSTGTSTIVSGDEGESELDLEYASGNAPGATVVFIYTGNSQNNGVFDSLAYAVSNNLAPILSLSYGACETSFTASDFAQLEPVLKQANTQGQTVLISSGDTGAASCETGSAPTVASGGLSVSYPASSVYATGVGGTQLNGNTSTYWSSSNNAYAGSALGYIPEIAWNDTAAYGSLSESGGGASAAFSKPSWQSGTGVPSDGHRDVPDVAFAASVEVNGYIVCTADGKNSCTNSTVGFSTGGGSLVGGTSAAAPSFAGMLAIVEQANGGGSLGNINPNLYTLAAGSSASSIFHDITSGNNIVPCTGGSTGCSSTTAGTNGTMGYTAGVGYDQVTGLGSIAIPALQSALKATTATVLTPTVSLTATTTTPAVNATDVFTVAVSGTGSTPAGSVTFSVDGTAVSTATLSSGSATFSYAFTTTGAHTVTAAYGGSTTYAAGSATLSVTVTAATAASSITLSSSPSSTTVSSGSSGTETITVTSVNGYTGSVGFTASLVSSTGATFSGCYKLSPTTVNPTSGGTAATTMTIYTSSSSCTTAGSISLAGVTASTQGVKTVTVAANATESRKLPGGLVLLLSGGVLGCCLIRRRATGSLLVLMAGVVLVGSVTGCGSGGAAATSTSTSTTTTTTTATTAGTYVIQVKGTSVASSTVSATTTFTLIVQ